MPFSLHNEDLDRLQGFHRLVVVKPSSSSEISDNSEKRPTELEGSRDARDKAFKAFRVFKGEFACYSTPSLRKYSAI